jgi:hypothetical protein
MYRFILLYFSASFVSSFSHAHILNGHVIATEEWIGFMKDSPESPCIQPPFHTNLQVQAQNKASAVYTSSRVILLARPQSFADFVDRHVVGITQHTGILANIGKNPGLITNVHMLINTIISKSDVFPLTADHWLLIATKLMDRIIRAWDGKDPPMVCHSTELVCICEGFVRQLH